MKTKDYIKEFKLDLEDYEFNREEFIRALGKEFLDRLELIHIARVNKGMDFPFKVFQELDKEMQTKFWSISNKKAGEPFSEKLFSAFFALHVIPIRANLFPNLHAELEEKRKKAIERDEKIKAELEAKEKEEKAKQKRMKPILEAIIAYGAAQSMARKQKQMKDKPNMKR